MKISDCYPNSKKSFLKKLAQKFQNYTSWFNFAVYFSGAKVLFVVEALVASAAEIMRDYRFVLSRILFRAATCRPSRLPGLTSVRL